MHGVIAIVLLLVLTGCATTPVEPLPTANTVYFTPSPQARTNTNGLEPPRDLRVPDICPLDSPTWKVISPYGPRARTRNSRTSFHEGIDIKGERGCNVVATAKGVVTVAHWMSGYGRVVVVDHGNGYRTIYGHMSSFSVEKGEQVQKGQALGRQGATGNASTAHVHYEIWKEGKHLNPADFMPQP